jgi:hypothetical protein
LKFISRKKEDKAMAGPVVNQNKKDLKLIGIIAITGLLMLWVVYLGLKAERTVKIVMIAQDVFKNQMISEEMIKPYDILRGEFEKYGVVTDNTGAKKRRLILWEERHEALVGMYAAYPLKKDTFAERRDFVATKIDNSDMAMRSFPGKELVPLSITSSELEAFKTYLKPGDRVNVQAIYTEKKKSSDQYGGFYEEESFKSETVFGSVAVADLLNNSGESILDIYTWMNNQSMDTQEQLNNSNEFRSRLVPKTLLLALTPDEKERYYYFLSKSGITFKASLPQRN